MILRRTPKIKRLRPSKPRNEDDNDPIDDLLRNRLSLTGLVHLREKVTADELSDIIQRIYDLNEKYIQRLSMVEGALHKLNELKNSQRNRVFRKRMKQEFWERKGEKHVIVVEGDSWFNYPVLLTDLIDRIGMEKNFALYSVAAGGDWLLNMLSAREYIEELSVIHPDVFLISGGGNDLVGSNRIAAMLEPTGLCKEIEHSELSQFLLQHANRDAVPFDKTTFNLGAGFLWRDFFALLQFFHLQYWFLLNGVLRNGAKDGDKFYPIKIVTQGYDFAIPNSELRFGTNLLLWYVPIIRKFLGHGGWLKRPMLLRGVFDPQKQEAIVYAMIYLFNEMMIYTGQELNKKFGGNFVFHIDSRGSVGRDGWADELHPKPRHFMRTGEAFVACIKNE
jgi:hypothetical protein